MFNSALAANAVAAGGTVGAGMNQFGVVAGIQQQFRAPAAAPRQSASRQCTSFSPGSTGASI